ncbi:MAG TPA: BamA/TamA family outer membrane protein [Kofleriaceae bacterium]|nr:BamA/TamA family outer membrane protein [Kofleriaceae bacterium]
MALVVAMVAAACAGRARPAPREDRGFGTIAVVGEVGLTERELLDGLASVRARELGQPFEPALVRADRERVVGQYVRKGYFDVDVEVDVDRRGRSYDVRFHVREGPRATVAGLAITGMPADVDAALARRAVGLDLGEPFDYDAYDRGKAALLAQLGDDGYAHAVVDASVLAHRTKATAQIRFDVTPGVKARFGEVEVTGVNAKLAEAARHRLEIRPGQVYSRQAITRSQEALYAMGRFASARVEPELDGGGEIVPVHVLLVEPQRNELRLGVGVGVDPASYQARTRIGYALTGFPEPLTTSRIEIRPALVYLRDQLDTEPRIEAAASMERLDLFAPRVIGEVRAGYTYTAFEAYTSTGPDARLSLRRPIYRQVVQGAIGWQLRYLAFTNLDDVIDPVLAAELGLDHNERLGFYEQSVIVDLRDSPVSPRRGVYGELRLEEGTVAAGGALDYLRITPEVRAFLPLGPIVVAGRVRFGAINGDIPVTQRYLEGGAYSHRGFPERRLAPTAVGLVGDDLREVPFGGGGMFIVSGEIRAPLAKIRGLPIGGAAFVDGGDVTERVSGLDLLDLYWAVGPGLRIQTVIGAVRFDLGIRINRLGPGNLRPGERFAYHLSIGEAF